MLRVYVVSPLPAVRAGLRALIEAAPDCEVIGEAEDLELAAAQSFEYQPDVVVANIEAGLSSSELALMQDSEDGPGLVLFGPIPGDSRLAAELRERAWGYLPRDSSAEQLLAAIRAVANRLVAIDPALSSRISASSGDSVLATEPSRDVELTAREREVLQLVAVGLANKSIATRLSISEHTVKFHVAAILAKLGAGSRTEAVHLGARRGLVAL